MEIANDWSAVKNNCKNDVLNLLPWSMQEE